ncbi:MAG: hypothetical protein H6626_02365 [Pseudobdellovibrionaceae bacterium]|nr:hypothetical protein [Bdellovibrionales bacterium]USN47956.1 MAG: hypothetical protein H6626_02365 [Pseudobdellovibrionaceae bacterium]
MGTGFTNIFFDSSGAYPCTNSLGSCFDRGTGIDTSMNTDYFTSKSSPVFVNWDFDTKWQENEGHLPTLQNEKTQWISP